MTLLRTVLKRSVLIRSVLIKSESNSKAASPFPGSGARLIEEKEFSYRIELSGKGFLEANRGRLAALSKVLNSLSPLSHLKRGFSICKKAKEETIVKSIDDVSIGDELSTRVTDGEILSLVRELFKKELTIEPEN